MKTTKGNKLIGKDKLYHFIAGIIITVIAFFFIGYYSVIVTIMFALGKEGYDYINKTKGTVELLDFLFTMLGMCIGIAIVTIKL